MAVPEPPPPPGPDGTPPRRRLRFVTPPPSTAKRVGRIILTPIVVFYVLVKLFLAGVGVAVLVVIYRLVFHGSH